MNTLSYRTVSVNKEAADKKWLLVDAQGQTLGRLASKVANIARGKYKPCFTPNTQAIPADSALLPQARFW